jgi:Stress responsive A/B Barrel Domain
VIQHIVLFTPKPDASQTCLRSLALALETCVGSISSIRRATVGRNVRIDAGYERSFGDVTYEFAAVLEFADEAGLVSYLRHPRHEELGRLFWACCERTVICEVEQVDLADVTSVSTLLRRAAEAGSDQAN